jgi:hypothetical protein
LFEELALLFGEMFFVGKQEITVLPESLVQSLT